MTATQAWGAWCAAAGVLPLCRTCRTQLGTGTPGPPGATTAAATTSTDTRPTFWPLTCAEGSSNSGTSSTSVSTNCTQSASPGTDGTVTASAPALGRRLPRCAAIWRRFEPSVPPRLRRVGAPCLPKRQAAPASSRCGSFGARCARSFLFRLRNQQLPCARLTLGRQCVAVLAAGSKYEPAGS